MDLASGGAHGHALHAGGTDRLGRQHSDDLTPYVVELGDLPDSTFHAKQLASRRCAKHTHLRVRALLVFAEESPLVERNGHDLGLLGGDAIDGRLGLAPGGPHGERTDLHPRQHALGARHCLANGLHVAE
jgi:hypothetical protein